MHQRPDTSGSLFSMRLFNAERDLPIVYAANYNISMIGLEQLSRFDVQKYGKMAQCLNDEFLNTPFARHRHSNEPYEEGEVSEGKSRRLRYLKPNRPVSRKELEIHHSAEFVERIHDDKSLVAQITETWALNLIPSCTIETRLLTPLKWQVAGTIFATYLAMQHGWAINLGGGFHQCSANHGETFCLFSDVFITMRHIWQRRPLHKFMIIDLDAHQATGIERDLLELEPKRRQMVFMVDVFNNAIQPPDQHADKGIDIRVELSQFTGDETYLKRLKETLASAFERFKPTIIIYVAGQDVLRDDPLGLMNLSSVGLTKRDELVFASATERGCPIVMLLAGGYLKRGIKIQTDSIRNLFAKNLIWGGHRSGARSLSRPRVVQETSSPASRSSHSGELPVQLTAKNSLLPVRKMATAVRAAPVESRFLHKKPSGQAPAASDIGKQQQQQEQQQHD